MKTLLLTISLTTFCLLSFSSTVTSGVETLPPQDGYSLIQKQDLHSRFDLATWQLDGDIQATRYFYTHMSEFFLHATIAREGEPSTLKVAPSESIGDISVETHHGTLTLDQWAQNHLDGVIVIHKGTIIYERYPRMRMDDRHVWMSVSKSVVGTLVGILEQQGKIDVSLPIDHYIPELKKTGWQGTPVIDILDMASGMSGLESDDPEAYTNPESAYGLFEASLGLQSRTPKTMDSTYDYMTSLVRLKPSGKKHEYTSVNTFVLSWLIEKVTDKPYASVIQDVIWRNMGADRDGLLQQSQFGAPGSHGLIFSTLRDLGRYGMLFTPSWEKVSETRVVPQAFIDKLQTSGRPEIIRAGMAFDYFNGYALGDIDFGTYQFDYSTNDGDFAKAGYHGQTLYISPTKDLVVASFATGEKYDTLKFARLLARSLEAVK